MMYDACNIHPPKRKDCGYPGISVTECYIWGKYQSHKDGMKEMLRCLSGWCVLGSSCWWLSGYDVQSEEAKAFQKSLVIAASNMALTVECGKLELKLIELCII